MVGSGDAMNATVSKCEVIDGVLAVNKEAGWTSHDVVAKVRGLLGGSKVGHAGTLDPAATGLLPVLIGKGTRIAEYLVTWDKEYRAQLRLMRQVPSLRIAPRVISHRKQFGKSSAGFEAKFNRYHRCTLR